MTVEFKLDGKRFVALNGGPHYKITPAISFVIDCKTQKEVDHYWSKLTKGGKEIQCGWLVDKFGVSWQVVPTAFNEMLRSADRKRAGQAMRKMYTMQKLNIAELQAAYDA